MMQYKYITKGSQGKEHNGFNSSTCLGQLERCSTHKDQFQVKSPSRAVTDWGQFRDKLGQCKGTFRHKLTRVAPTREVLLRLTLLTSLDQLLFILKIIFTFFHKTSYLNEELNCTEPFLSVSIPCTNCRPFVK
jgi:hypothetical protein